MNYRADTISCQLTTIYVKVPKKRFVLQQRILPLKIFDYELQSRYNILLAYSSLCKSSKGTIRFATTDFNSLKIFDYELQSRYNILLAYSYLCKSSKGTIRFVATDFNPLKIFDYELQSSVGTIHIKLIEILKQQIYN